MLSIIHVIDIGYFWQNTSVLPFSSSKCVRILFQKLFLWPLCVMLSALILCLWHSGWDTEPEQSSGIFSIHTCVVPGSTIVSMVLQSKQYPSSRWRVTGLKHRTYIVALVKGHIHRCNLKYIANWIEISDIIFMLQFMQWSVYWIKPLLWVYVQILSEICQ